MTNTFVTRNLVEDVATGQVISDDTKTQSSETSLIWDGNFLMKCQWVYNNELTSSYVYSYTDGLLVEVTDEVDGQQFHLSYSDGHLENITITTDSDALEIMQLLYDEQGHAKSAIKTRSDGSGLTRAQNVLKQVFEFEYSANNISRINIQYYDSLLESAKPMDNAATTYVISYNSAINPFNGIFSLLFINEPWTYFSENSAEEEHLVINKKAFDDIDYETTIDRGYPVKQVDSKSKTDILDGKRVTTEYSHIVDYEYLD